MISKILTKLLHPSFLSTTSPRRFCLLFASESCPLFVVRPLRQCINRASHSTPFRNSCPAPQSSLHCVTTFISLFLTALFLISFSSRHIPVSRELLYSCFCFHFYFFPKSTCFATFAPSPSLPRPLLLLRHLPVGQRGLDAVWRRPREPRPGTRPPPHTWMWGEGWGVPHNARDSPVSLLWWGRTSLSVDCYVPRTRFSRPSPHWPPCGWTDDHMPSQMIRGRSSPYFPLIACSAALRKE